ncbi:MAG: family 1 encapsulin nanocompartment shell protein [Vampirovibrionales bacterium]
MQDFLSHNEAPISDTQWDDIDKLIIEVVKQQLIGRRFIHVFGPLGAGVQWVSQDILTGNTKGQLDVLGESSKPHDTVQTLQRVNIHLPLLYKDFMLYWRDIETSRKFGIPLDLSAAAAAASACARSEDEMIFHGFEDAESQTKHDGLLNTPGSHQLVASNWHEAGGVFKDILTATETLAEAGFYAPYAVVVSPRTYSQLHRYMNVTGMMEIEYIRQVITDGVYASSVIPENTMLVVSTGVQNFDLAIAQDYKTAYLGAQNMNHPFRVLASLALRIKRPGAICVLKASTPQPATTLRHQSQLVLPPELKRSRTQTATNKKPVATAPKRRGRPAKVKPEVSDTVTLTE